MPALHRVRVVVAPDKLSPSRGGGITGPLYLSVQGLGEPRAFPGVDSSDFAVRALAAWLDELARVVDRGAVGLFYFGGAGHFTVALADRGRFRIRRKTQGEWITEAKDFAASLYAAAAAVLAECDRRGWSDREVAELRDALAASSGARAG